MIGLVYLLSVLVAVLVLAVVLRSRPVPTAPPAGSPVCGLVVFPVGVADEVGVIVAASVRLAARLAAAV